LPLVDSIAKSRLTWFRPLTDAECGELYLLARVIGTGPKPQAGAATKLQQARSGQVPHIPDADAPFHLAMATELLWPATRSGPNARV
jgi:hypothetical protein